MTVFIRNGLRAHLIIEQATLDTCLPMLDIIYKTLVQKRYGF